MMCTISSPWKLHNIIWPQGSRPKTSTASLICTKKKVWASPWWEPWYVWPWESPLHFLGLAHGCALPYPKPTTSGLQTLHQSVPPHKTNDPKAPNKNWKWQFEHNFLHHRYQSAPPSINSNSPFHNSGAMLGKRPTTQLVKLSQKSITEILTSLLEIVWDSKDCFTMWFRVCKKNWGRKPGTLWSPDLSTTMEGASSWAVPSVGTVEKHVCAL